MRGFPPLHVIIFTLAFALLAIPLSRLTFARPEPSVTTAHAGGVGDSPAYEVPMLVRVRTAHLPSTLSLMLDGRMELLRQEYQRPTESTFEFERNIPLPRNLADGIEIFARATWPEGTPDTALTIELEPLEDLSSRSATQWSGGSTELAAPFSFSW